MFLSFLLLCLLYFFESVYIAPHLFSHRLLPLVVVVPPAKFFWMESKKK